MCILSFIKVQQGDPYFQNIFWKREDSMTILHSESSPEVFNFLDEIKIITVTTSGPHAQQHIDNNNQLYTKL